MFVRSHQDDDVDLDRKKTEAKKNTKGGGRQGTTTRGHDGTRTETREKKPLQVGSRPRSRASKAETRSGAPAKEEMEDGIGKKTSGGSATGETTGYCSRMEEGRRWVVGGKDILEGTAAVEEREPDDVNWKTKKTSL